jgi:glucokinase
VSLGGHVDVANGIVRRSLHVPGWEDVPLASLVRARFDAPALIENDANAGALGEWDTRGRPSSLCYVTVSTGVGSGIVFAGELWRGHDGLAGEIGHLVVEQDGELCACGRRGCVETIAAGPSIARHGDHARAARALASAVASLVAIVNPVVVAIGGGVAAAGAPLWDPLLAEFDRLRWADVTTHVVRAADDAALAGAAVLAARAAAGGGTLARS